MYKMFVLIENNYKKRKKLINSSVNFFTRIDNKNYVVVI